MTTTPVGKTVLTAQGLLALTNASRLGKKITPKHFKVSSKDYDLYPGVDLQDLEDVWLQGDISGVFPVDNNTTEFLIDIPPEEAKNFGRTFGLYLEDGTLFLVGKPPYPFAPLMRQTFKMQLVWLNANEIVDFKYIPFYETEQDLSLFETSIILGERILKLKAEVTRLEKARERLFQNDKELKQYADYILKQVNSLKRQLETLYTNQIALYTSVVAEGTLLIKLKRDIEKLKGGIA